MLLCYLFIILYRSYRAFLGLKPEGKCWFVRHGGLVCHASLKSEVFWLSKKIDLRVFFLEDLREKKRSKK